MTFEDQIQQKVRNTILSQISDTRLLEYHHSNKKHIPDEVIEKAWEGVNWDEVILFVTKELQDKVCQTIVQNMITETKTDVKKILAIQGIREKIRMEVYPKLKEALDID